MNFVLFNPGWNVVNYYLNCVETSKIIKLEDSKSDSFCSIVKFISLLNSFYFDHLFMFLCSICMLLDLFRFSKLECAIF